MCGLVGFIDKNKNEQILVDMLEMQAYRGPDDRGVFFDEKSGVHLGHNRLSIMDLSSNGHQPFVSDCGGYVIVFNGEVYNFKAIKEELLALGYKFVSNSDTEVILYSYKEWGDECLAKFIGMFAFAILDKNKNELFLCRDRAGVKPLYYYFDGINFIFSSEIKSFHKHPKFKKEQNLDALAYFFRFGYIPAPYSIFKDCFKLPAGCYLKFDIVKTTFKITKYWDVGYFYAQPKFNKNESEILNELEGLLDSAINLRTIADVPVGVFLSGGYDSSLVAALLSKTQKINTFTIGFDDARFNEAAHAKQVATHFGTNHHEYYINEADMLSYIDTLSFFYDEPFGDSSAVATMAVSKMAKQDVTVALSADGGDEHFCGYSKYFFLHKFQGIFSTSLKRNLIKIGLNLINEKIADIANQALPNNIRQTNFRDKFLKLKRAINSKNLDEMFINASSYVDRSDVTKFLKIGLKQEYMNVWKNELKLDFLDHMMMCDYKLFMCDDVLTKVDRATMSVSLEGREPLLDHRLIEYLARVPVNIKYKNNQPKYLLRQILYKYIPKDIIDKPKSGFQIPLAKWLRGDLRWLVEENLDSRALNDEIFDVKQIQNLKDRFYAGEELQSLIWFIVVYQMWKRRWLE